MDKSEMASSGQNLQDETQKIQIVNPSHSQNGNFNKGEEIKRRKHKGIKR